MISVETFKFPNGTLRCAGGKLVVQDAYNYFKYRNDNRQAVDMQQFINRIVNNGVYARLEPKTLKAKIQNLIYGYNRQLKQHGLYMTEKEYVEAMIITFPEKGCEIFKLTRLDFQCMKESTVWRKRFDID